MIENVYLRPVLRKIEKYLPPSLLSPASPSYLEKLGQIKPEEKKAVETLGNLEKEKRLSFLVNKFEEMNSLESSRFKLYDEQIVTLLRAIKGYEDPKTKGEILEMEMSEGKSFVVMPILVAYLSLKNPYLQVQTINPYLVDRDLAEFKRFAEFLGMSDHVGKIDRREKDGKNYLAYPSDDPEDPHNHIVFGLWSDFIHSSQFAFKENSLFYPDRPIIVLDEIDQVVQDEAVTPAIITEKIKTGDFFDQLIEKYNNYSKLEWTARFGDEDFNLEGLKIKSQEYVLASSEELINSAKSLYQIIGERERFFKQKEPNLSKKKFKENILNDLSELIFQGIIRKTLEEQTGAEVSLDVVERTNNEFYNQKGNLKTTLPFFWWDMPDFQQALIETYFLEKGVDYVIKEENSLKIKPLTKTTGYSASNKEFQDLIQLMLYIKEGLPLPQEISFNSTDTIPVGEFYQTVPRKIIGLTGSANSIAERLRHGYGLETTVIPPHNESQRQISWQIFSSVEEKEKRTLELLSNVEQQNSLIVVDSAQEAMILAEKLKKMGSNLEIETLTPRNEDQDRKLYNWISGKGDKRKILIAAKMIGRGVDLQPTEDIKKSGFLLISLTPFGFERTFKQLTGRVGRRGEKGIIYVFVSPEDDVFNVLTSDEHKKLRKAFKSNDQQTVKNMVESAWRKNEEDATVAAKQQHTFYQPFSQLRSWMKENRLKNPIVTEKIKQEWSGFLEEARVIFDGLMVAGQGGLFVGGGEERIWSSLVLGAVDDYRKKLEKNPNSDLLKFSLISFLRKHIRDRLIK